MIRRDYSATSYSPLTQITAANASKLELAWMWPMREGGTNQPAPLVYNGTMYLANTGGIVQALNARTGQLIWEHAVGAEVAPRGLALYGNLLIFHSAAAWALNRQDAYLIALDARTGETAWKVQMPDVYASNSGPHHRQRPHRPGHGHLPDLRREEVLHQRLRPGNRSSSAGASARSRGAASRAAIPGARCRISIVPAARRGSPGATTPS